MAWHVSRAKTKAHEPRILPGNWRYLQTSGFQGVAFIRNDGLKVFTSHERQDDDPREWLHVSMSRAHRLPKWKEVREVKDIFIGKDKTAIQILPPDDKYVNCHNYVLHLFCCLNQEILPDFRKGGLL